MSIENTDLKQLASRLPKAMPNQNLAVGDRVLVRLKKHSQILQWGYIRSFKNTESLEETDMLRFDRLGENSWVATVALEGQNYEQMCWLPQDALYRIPWVQDYLGFRPQAPSVTAEPSSIEEDPEIREQSERFSQLIRNK